MIPQEGNAEHGVIVGRAYSDRQQAPPAPVGELWLVHKSGSSLKLRNDGTIAIVGDLHVEGEVFDRKGSLDHLRSSYNRHHHYSANGSQTGDPIPQD